MKDKQLKHGFTERQVASYNTKPHGLQDEDLRTLASFPKKGFPYHTAYRLQPWLFFGSPTCQPTQQALDLYRHHHICQFLKVNQDPSHTLSPHWHTHPVDSAALQDPGNTEDCKQWRMLRTITKSHGSCMRVELIAWSTTQSLKKLNGTVCFLQPWSSLINSWEYITLGLEKGWVPLPAPVTHWLHPSLEAPT